MQPLPWFVIILIILFKDSMAQDLEYEYDYQLVCPPTPPFPAVIPSPQQILQMATNDFQALFPFPDCGNVISVGQVCHLSGLFGLPGDNPIKVYGIDSTSFTFLSLPGHAEGAGRYISFTFAPLIMEPDCISLYVHAWGPWSLTAEITRDSGLAESVWASYANNIADAINDGTVNNY
jgi:hypothetical protein